MLISGRCQECEMKGNLSVPSYISKPFHDIQKNEYLAWVRSHLGEEAYQKSISVYGDFEALVEKGYTPKEACKEILRGKNMFKKVNDIKNDTAS